MGFREIIELPWRKGWLPSYGTDFYAPPRLASQMVGDSVIDPVVERAFDLAHELEQGSKHMAILAIR